MYPYTPRKESELELVEGDYVFASSKQDPNGRVWISSQ